MERQQSQSNIELLRIFSMLGVIVLHYNNTKIGGAFALASGVNQGILFALESIFICGVNVYMLISGYFLCLKSSRRLLRPVELLAQVILFQGGFYVLGILLGQREFRIGGLLESLLPDNYFVILYIVCFLVSPYLNVVFHKIGQKQSFCLVVLSFLVFSVWPTAVDVLQELTGTEWAGLSSIGIGGSQGGYTIVNFVLLYSIGAYIRLYQKKEYCGTTLLAALAGSVALLWGWAVFNNSRGILGGSAWEYCNPIVIAEAVILLLLFRKMRLRNNGVINMLAKGAFTVYLLHAAFLPYLAIPKAVSANPVLMLLHMILSSVAIYLICFVCYVIYAKVTGSLFGLLERKWTCQMEVKS